MCNRWDRWWWHSLFTCKLATPPGGRGLEVRQVGQVMVTEDSLWLPSSSSGGWKNQWILVSLICVSAVLGFMFQHQQKLHTDMRVKHKHCKYARDTDKTQTLQTCTRYWRNTNTANMHEIQTKHQHCKHQRDTDDTDHLRCFTVCISLIRTSDTPRYCLSLKLINQNHMYTYQMIYQLLSIYRR